MCAIGTGPGPREAKNNKQAMLPSKQIEHDPAKRRPNLISDTYCYQVKSFSLAELNRS